MHAAFHGRKALVVTIGVALTLGAAAWVLASDFTGYADTGFTYTNKGRCCDDAVMAARDDSAASCEAAGGFPNYSRSSARGRCDWQTQRDSQGRSRFRCTATATVQCR